MIPPKENGEFVACMEDVLSIYHREYDPEVPVVCMDEQPVQMVEETRDRIPAAAGRAERIDYEYRRNGTANVFLFVEPLGAWRRTSVRERRTKKDWAIEIRHLLEEDYPDAKKVILVCDNLNTHKRGSLYDTFPPEVARSLIERVEIHYTPKHGSWLNIAECELSAMTRQSINPRVPDLDTLIGRTTAWTKNRNKNQTGVDWQFTNEKARIKLKRLYPQVQD